MKPLIAIVGNTGVGKSHFAVELAKALNGEIINADAMQMYQGLDAVTNKHPVPEREGIPHHFIGTESWSKQLTVQNFESSASSLIDRLHQERKLPIVVGGTHYYVQSLIAENAIIKHGSTSSPAADIEEKLFTESQLSVLNDPKQVESMLREVDPVILAKFHPNDTRRLRRALEIWFETGTKASDIYESQKSGDDAQKLRLRYKVLVFWIWCDKAVLNTRLDHRVDLMVQQGLLDEVNELFKEYDPEKSQTGIWQVLGFKQFLPYLQEPSKEHLALSLESMKSDTRQYAKKQTKWIRNKLLPMVDSLGGTYALLDSSDLTQFESEVAQRGKLIAANWLQGNSAAADLPLVPSHLLDETERKRRAFSKDQWIRHRCDACSSKRSADVILIGDDELRIHLASKQHRAATSKAKVEKFEE